MHEEILMGSVPSALGSRHLEMAEVHSYQYILDLKDVCLKIIKTFLFYSSGQ